MSNDLTSDLNRLLADFINDRRWCVCCAFWKCTCAGDEHTTDAMGECSHEDAAWSLEGLRAGSDSCILMNRDGSYKFRPRAAEARP
jgi:hypothetical protein